MAGETKPELMGTGVQRQRLRKVKYREKKS